jgi:hypothetical protein
MDLLAFPFPVFWTWTFAAGLGLLLAWTPWRPAALALSAIPVVVAVAWTVVEVRAGLLPPVMFVAVFQPGTTAKQVQEFEQTRLVRRMERGYDFLPGVIQQGAAAAGPGGVYLAARASADTAAHYVLFTGRSKRGQRADMAARALAARGVDALALARCHEGVWTSTAGRSTASCATRRDRRSAIRRTVTGRIVAGTDAIGSRLGRSPGGRACRHGPIGHEARVDVVRPSRPSSGVAKMSADVRYWSRSKPGEVVAGRSVPIPVGHVEHALVPDRCDQPVEPHS